MWSGCGRTIKDIQRSKCESLPGSSTKDIYRPKCESLPGTSVKFNNTYFLNDTINNQNPARFNHKCPSPGLAGGMVREIRCAA